MTDTPPAADTGIKLIVIDNPPVNSLGLAVRRMLAAEFAAAANDPNVRAVVLAGAGGRFSAGADIREFNDPGAIAELHLSDVIDRIEALDKPVVAAVDGVALGGGLELALGCHYRVAAANARIGLTEITLGLLPGAGGTQRLPRAIDFARAIELITSGQMVAASDPRLAGLFDEVTEGDARAAALDLAARLISDGAGPRRLSAVTIEPGPAEAALAQARETLLPSPVPAMAAILDCLDDAIHADIRTGLAHERARFDQVVATPAARALRHAFFAEREVGKVPGLTAETPTLPVETVAVIGAGTMGRGISIAALDAGFQVKLVDANATALERAAEAIERHYRTMVERGRLGETEARVRGARLSPTADLDAAAQAADLVIEAVFEDMTVKQEVLRKLDELARPETILATNTSTLNVDTLADATARPGQVVGMHFFSPANIMRLVEVVRGKATADSTLATALKVVTRLRKVGVVAGVCDGFIGNRMLEEYLRQAYFLMDEGALPQEIDGALERWGMAMGPLRMMDLAGNDVGWAIRKRRKVEQPDRPYSAIPDLICERGRYGQKTGAGFYRYEGRKAIPDPEVEQLIREHSASLGLGQREISPEEIVERCIYALINEGTAVLADGIALRASDIDVVYLAGYGFPRYRGGPMHYANEVGLDAIVAAMDRFAQGYQGQFWKPAPLLAELARAGGTFT
ncbi:3-hydroxyacyl-CoA dehydrogenase NAD-binding domain-containing protein [Rhodoligotrophos defluvii]|uniref:3-hydroxyacyl-CoA dehydrogenase NAD-binding domain-containing protein n=1 Tax=Rhodoligotrophos defluvii TaxID=2561934 RepID=UPI0010C9C2A5|nr:3-hydroxyacyl-CoA dehydrogenase NAD-binding domain-containing protein [Rhodoligotrophos defluvii]